MARTAAANKNNLTALEEYERLPDFRKRLTWLYYRGEETHNREGLNGYDVPGSATDFTSCGTVKDYIVKSTFRYWAKVSTILNKNSSLPNILAFSLDIFFFSSYHLVLFYRKQLHFQNSFINREVNLKNFIFHQKKQVNKPNQNTNQKKKKKDKKKKKK
jgi:hypothetical protein